MSRCKCCDVLLLDWELRRTKPDGKPEDLCTDCFRIVQLDVEDMFEYREYAFGLHTESPLVLTGYDFDAELSGNSEDW